VSKEFGEAVQEIGFALKDGKLEKHEVQKCKKELHDLILASLQMEAYLQDAEKKLKGN